MSLFSKVLVFVLITDPPEWRAPCRSILRVARLQARSGFTNISRALFSACLSTFHNEILCTLAMQRPYRSVKLFQHSACRGPYSGPVPKFPCSDYGISYQFHHHHSAWPSRWQTLSLGHNSTNVVVSISRACLPPQGKTLRPRISIYFPKIVVPSRWPRLA